MRNHGTLTRWNDDPQLPQYGNGWRQRWAALRVAVVQMMVRMLDSGDARAFQEIRLRGLLECPTAFSSSHEEEVDTPVEIIAQRLAPRPDGAVWGYFIDTALRGVIGIQRERHLKLAHKAVIWGMYVAPESRRHGLGRSLVSHALDHARSMGVRQVNLGVNARNTPATRLYEVMGFRIHGTETGFLCLDGVLHDEHLMSVTL